MQSIRKNDVPHLCAISSGRFAEKTATGTEYERDETSVKLKSCCEILTDKMIIRSNVLI